MKMQINEAAELAGISVRTLHYYDEINLLKPSYVNELNGYRYYDEDALARLQEILFYRELDFPLKAISEILSSPQYDKEKALSEQKRLLLLKKERLERLIQALDNAAKGENTMSLKEFDNSEYEKERQKYADEVREKWGDTAAYKEFENKSSDGSRESRSEIEAGMDRLIGEFAECAAEGAAADSEAAGLLARKWQEYITANYYSCTDEILSGLAEMYAGDERFRENIDRHGSGTAEFMSGAIKAYCAGK